MIIDTGTYFIVRNLVFRKKSAIVQVSILVTKRRNFTNSKDINSATIKLFVVVNFRRILFNYLKVNFGKKNWFLFKAVPPNLNSKNSILILSISAIFLNYISRNNRIFLCKFAIKSLDRISFSFSNFQNLKVITIKT